MSQETNVQPDYGTGKKTLGVYLLGVISCVLLTLIAFGAVMANTLPKWQVLSIIFVAASIQLLVQVICFLRLNIQTEQAKINVMVILFTGVILLSILAGSLWIMWNCNYYMMYM